MVVKNPAIGENYELSAVDLAEYVRKLMESDDFKHSSPEYKVQLSYDIIKSLMVAEFQPNPKDSFAMLRLLTPLNRILEQATKFDVQDGFQLLYNIVETFLNYISDPEKHPSAAASIIVRVFTNNAEANNIMSIWLLRGDHTDDTHKKRVSTSLECVFRWIYQWPCTKYFADWVISYIKLIEDTEHLNTLIDKALEYLEQLLGVMVPKTPLIKYLSRIILHLLASLRELPETLDKIAPYMEDIFKWLANDNRRWTRGTLQDLVDLVSAIMMDHVRNHTKNAQSYLAFRDKYIAMFNILDVHMASTSSKILANTIWTRTVPKQITRNLKPSTKKVGLVNLGNTCYVNSIIQALLLTKNFSHFTMTEMADVPYWSCTALLFAKMKFSKFTKLNLIQFYTMVRPTYFVHNQQQDSSEFLGYLLTLLEQHELCTDSVEVAELPCSVEPLQRRPATAYIVGADSGTTSLRPSCSTSIRTSPRVSPRASPGSSPTRSPAPSCSRARNLPSRESTSRASCSTAVSSRKRAANASNPDGPPRKRLNAGQSTRIQSFFGGTLATLIVCRVCHTESRSYDSFRELQLAFPEKPTDNRHSVQGLLYYFCSTEVMTGANQYMCHVCGGKRDAERSVLIERCPEYLTLVLKNYSYQPKLQRQTKLFFDMDYNTSVFLPTVPPIITRESAYNLYAAVIHSGNSLHTGHYYTMGKDEDQWYMYDDDFVHACEVTELTKLTAPRTPYILFYRRADIEEASLPPTKDLPQRVLNALY